MARMKPGSSAHAGEREPVAWGENMSASIDPDTEWVRKSGGGGGGDGDDDIEGAFRAFILPVPVHLHEKWKNADPRPAPRRSSRLPRSHTQGKTQPHVWTGRGRALDQPKGPAGGPNTRARLEPA